MSKNNASVSAPKICRAVKFFVIFTAFLFGFVMSVPAQKTSWLFEQNELLEKLLSPQAVRPDVLWMRGGHYSEVFDMKFSPDGQKIVTSGRDGTVKIFRTSDGILLRTFTKPDGLRLEPGSVTIEVSPNSQTLAVADLLTSPFADSAF